MASRHLHELLKEEQEPFVLKNYINERRCHLRKPTSKAHHHSLHLGARRHVSQNSSFLSSFRQMQPCFFHSCDPEAAKSPVVDFPKSPRRNSNTLLLNVPSMTAALLLESALRIQKQSLSSKKLKNRGFGFFGTILKRIALWKAQKREIYMESLTWDSFEDLRSLAERRIPKDAKMEVGLERNKTELGFSFSLQRSNQMEDSKEKSQDIESSSCCCSRDLQETVLRQRTNRDSRSCEKESCSSPFRFQGLEWEPESGFRTPEFGSPAISPPQQTEVSPCMSSGHNGSTSSQESDRGYTEGEEKEQSSPVSILEPPFEDDLEVHESEDYEADEEDEGSFENNFAAIQRVKQKLLNKIQRFERLADLDPLDLEELLAEEVNEEEEEEKKEEGIYHNKDNVKEIETRVLFECTRTGQLDQETQQQGRKYQCLWRIPCDIITESWNNFRPTNIQDLLEVEFRRANDEWRRNRGELQEIAEDMELAILGFLIRELSHDLVQSRCL